MKDKILKKTAIILAKLLLKVFKQVHGKDCDFSPKEGRAESLTIWVFHNELKMEHLNDELRFIKISNK